jgi:dTMP kinase
MKKGTFITLEGIDFSGKSTQARLLVAALKKNHISCLHLREPGGTRLSEKVRRMLLNKGDLRICPQAELWLYLAARAQLVTERIKPALQQGRVVICDRFDDSTLAYQAYGRGLDKRLVARANALATGGLTPDLTILFDLEPAQALQRSRRLKRTRDRLEREREAFFEKVREGYLTLAAQSKSRIKVIDASRPTREVWTRLWEIILRHFGKHGLRIE